MLRPALLVSAALLTFPTSVWAQNDDVSAQADDGGIAEIIVTAQRREESSQDIPIAISAFDADALAARGIASAIEVTQYVPNLVGLNNTGLGTANSYFLRGVGNTETIATFDPPIGTYVDDVYISRQNGNNLQFFDVGRVEVLRGPQGTLFGRNTTGGAISFVMAEPGDDVGGYAEAGYGSYDRKHARASVDVPLAPTFAVKLSGYWQDDDGYTKNTVTGERTNESDGWGIRLGLRGELSDNVRWTGAYMHTFADATNVLNFDCNPAVPTQCDGRFATTGLKRNNDFGGRFTGPKDDFGAFNKVSMDMVTSNLQIGGDSLRLNLITGFVDLTQKFALDFSDGRGLPSVTAPTPPQRNYTLGGFTITNFGQHTQFTQEAKLTGSMAGGLIDYVGGVYYFHESNDTDFGDLFNLGGPGPTGFPFVLADRRMKNKTSALAGYFQADVNVTDQLTLTGGIRYTDEEKTFSVRDNRAACQTVPLGAGCIDNSRLIATNGAVVPRKQTAKLWTPRVAVNFRPSSDLLLFASATRGFKSGGWNARGYQITSGATFLGTEILPFGPEKAWSYEAGFKADLLDRKLRANLTVFQLDVGGLQTPSALIRPNGSIAFITRNFADYRNRGVELELQARPVPELNLFASLGYQDDKYILPAGAPAFDAFGIQSVAAQQAVCRTQLAAGRVPGGSGTDAASSCGVGIVAPDGSLAEPVRTPKWTLALGGSYDADLGGGLSFVPAINANWRAKSEVGTSELSLYSQGFTSAGGVTYGGNPYGNGTFIAGSFSEARWIVNASLTLKSDAGWSIAAECKNCFDQVAVESALANYSYLNPPKTWGIRAKFDF